MFKIITAVFIFAALILSAPAFAVDGQILINQATVIASGGFPYKITQPGSYKLSGNLVVPTTFVNGIQILSSYVTLDLNGFKISGPVTCSGFSGAGLSCSSADNVGITSTFDPHRPNSDVTVRDGFVTGFDAGVVLAGTYNLIEEVHSSDNSSYGIILNTGIVRRSIAAQNGVNGMIANNATVVDNALHDNGAIGLSGDRITYGGNSLGNNAGGSVSVTHSVSHGNNICDTVAC